MMHRSRATLATASLLLLCSAAAFTQGLRWTKAAPFPEPDEELYGIAASGKMYVLGGFGTARGKNYEYDAAADKWTKKAPMPRPAHHQADRPCQAPFCRRRGVGRAAPQPRCDRLPRHEGRQQHPPQTPPHTLQYVKGHVQAQRDEPGGQHDGRRRPNRGENNRGFPGDGQPREQHG